MLVYTQGFRTLTQHPPPWDSPSAWAAGEEGPAEHHRLLTPTCAPPSRALGAQPGARPRSPQVGVILSPRAGRLRFPLGPGGCSGPALPPAAPPLP